MSNETYNGWTNYATWRVNLEIFDGFNPSEYYSESDMENLHEMRGRLKEYAEYVIFECCESNIQSLAELYAPDFLSNVDWRAITNHVLKNYV